MFTISEFDTEFTEHYSAAEPQPKPTVVAKPLFLPVVTAGREQLPAQSRRDETT
jgi:hypothetical protein